MNPVIQWTIPVVVSVYLAAAAQASEPVKIPAAAASCSACHGPAGDNPVSPDTPRLAGQERGYLAHALRQYRDGERRNPVMGAMAKPLSDAQIEALASYFAVQSGLTVKY